MRDKPYIFLNSETNAKFMLKVYVPTLLEVKLKDYSIYIHHPVKYYLEIGNEEQQHNYKFTQDYSKISISESLSGTCMGVFKAWDSIEMQVGVYSDYFYSVLDWLDEEIRKAVPLNTKNNKGKKILEFKI